MNAPATARRGNLLSAGAMAVAVVAAVVSIVAHGGVDPTAWAVMVLGTAVGAVAGAHAARTVRMTAMPQLVSLFNAVGGGAAALPAISHAPPAHRAAPGARVTAPGWPDV